MTPLPAAPVVPPELVLPALVVLAPPAAVLELPPALPPPSLLVLPAPGVMTLPVSPTPLSALPAAGLPLEASLQQPVALKANANNSPNEPLRLISQRLK
jgi:hypothetical protein